MALTSGNRYRHVVFTVPGPSRPLNLGAPQGVPRAAARPNATTTTTTTAVRPAPPGDCTRPHIPPGDTDPFLGWVFAEAGLSARNYRPIVLRRRLPACLRALRVHNLAEARRALRRTPQLIPLALDALLLGVTEFFRDPPAFECLRRELQSLFLPTAGRLRVWSAGCSEGAELYSVAILLAELGLLERCELLGTDCRPDALPRAEAGVFATDALRGLSVERVARFFEPVPDGRTRVAHALREHITWRRGDAVAAPEPGPWHLVLCRNTGMYLEPAAAQRLWRGLASVVSPGGLLVVGKAERPEGVAGLAPVGPCVYRRCGVPS